MATAAIISFEETRQTFAKVRARQQLHAQLDRWLDGLEANMPENPPSLEELTQAVFAMRQQLTGQITEALAACRRENALANDKALRLLRSRAFVQPNHLRVSESVLAREACLPVWYLSTIADAVPHPSAQQ